VVDQKLNRTAPAGVRGDGLRARESVPVQRILAAAIEMHRTGELAPAAQLYQKVLAREPENADALHLLGVLRHQRGDHAAAVDLIRRAIVIQPSVPAFHANLAEAYRALGQLERAVGCCRVALQLWPDYPEGLGNLGVALQALERHDEAVRNFQRALQMAPKNAPTHSNLGISLRKLGRRDEALSHFRQAVEIDPASASARTNLGLLLLDLGRAEESLPECREAARLRPEAAALHFNLGNVLRALNQPGAAKAAYAEALTLDPNLAQAHANLGQLLYREGQLAEALPWLRQAVEFKPDDANLWEQLGDLHTDREAPAEAIPCYERSLILKPERALVHNALGWALQEEGRIADAEEHYLTAERLNPGIPGTQVNIGGLEEERGNLDEAAACFRKALELNPAYGLPHARLATLLRGKLPDADRAALEARLAELSDDDEARPALQFGLAQVLDACGEFDGAGDCLRAANALSLAHAKKRHRDYDAAQHDEFVVSLLKGFDRAFFARTANGANSSRRPVFVFGLPRSGTTLIEQILASHSRIHGAGELFLVRRSFEAIPGVLQRSDWPINCLPHVDGSTVGKLARQHLQWLDGLDGGKADRIVDKMPDNYLYVGFIAAMFPNAVLIHCLRDLRDVAVSCWMTHFRSIRWANDQDHIAGRFTQYRRVMDHWRRVLPAPIHEVVYEDTVDDVEAVARRLVAACGMEWEPVCLEFHRTRRVVRTASVAQVRQPIYRQSVARWKHYRNTLGDLFERLSALDETTGPEPLCVGIPSSNVPSPVAEFV
jgi:tetratricopeptide (TPR) repeat protein